MKRCTRLIALAKTCIANLVSFHQERRKVVTIDGSLILKSGLMTGGTAHGGKSGLAERAKRWVRSVESCGCTSRVL